MASPRKPERGNVFRRVDEWREEQRARRVRETVERSRRVPPPGGQDEGGEGEAPDSEDKPTAAS